MIKRYSKFLESKKDKFPNFKRLDIDGYQVIMGKDALSNDYLTTIEANPDDLWFHCKGVPGSHLIIRNDGKSPTPEVIKKVAELAAKNSKAKDLATVVYCKAKFVKKEPNMKPGQVKVDYKNAEEIGVKI